MFLALSTRLLLARSGGRQVHGIMSGRFAYAGKPRGYAFVEYEHKNDMKTAYKMADGRKVEGRRVIVDVERGRTVPNW